MTALVIALALATQPTAAAEPQMVRAAGMALPDGALPPGTLTVRVVRNGFDDNVRDQRVEIEVGGQTTTAQTAADGRAQFAHLPVGAKVRALTTVDGRLLESDTFEMPSQSGIRVLFVIGNAAVASAPPPSSSLVPAPSPSPMAPAPAIAAPAPIVQASAVAADTPARDGQSGVATVRTVVIALTVLAFVGVAFQQRRAVTRSARGHETVAAD